MRQEHFIKPNHGKPLGSEEPFTTEREHNHWYTASADFAKNRLTGNGKLLCVASPVFEAIELESAGWDVTYLDIRKPPLLKNFVEGDACAMPFPDKSFDAVSTTCVLCHVGLGRYGDNEREFGDELMLAEIARVLKPGGMAHVTFGPVSSEIELSVKVGDSHRVYTEQVARDLSIQAGLSVVEMKVWNVIKSQWGMGRSDILDANYLVTLLRKD